MLRELNLWRVTTPGYRALMGGMLRRVKGLWLTCAAVLLAPAVADAAPSGTVSGWRCRCRYFSRNRLVRMRKNHALKFVPRSKPSRPRHCSSTRSRSGRSSSRHSDPSPSRRAAWSAA